VPDVVSRNPMTGEPVYRAAAASAAEVHAAVRRAGDAHPGWAGKPVTERAAALHRFADLVDREAAGLASLITRETGKRAVEAASEVEWTALSARWYADHPPVAERHAGALVRRVPLGVIAVVTPWNVPLITPAWKWLPALLAGNAVCWKPSELATGTAAAAVRLLHQAGVPPDVVQLVPGAGETARALCGAEEVAGVHFTGSTRSGRALATLVAPRFARCALEMGGVNCALVFADADLDAAADAIVASATSINGQKCSAVRRVLVQDDVAAALRSRLAERVEAVVPGDPADEATTLGPLISSAARDAAERAVESAVTRGGRVAAQSPAGPTAPGSTGTGPAAFPATLLTDLPDGDPLETDEVFAPILTLERFRTVPEAWSRATRSPYGLCAAVYTADAATAREAAERLPVGILAVNRRSDAVDLAAPFGGRGHSGNGYPEGGAFVYSAVTDVLAVYADLP